MIIQMIHDTSLNPNLLCGMNFAWAEVSFSLVVQIACHRYAFSLVIRLVFSIYVWLKFLTTLYSMALFLDLKTSPTIILTWLLYTSSDSLGILKLGIIPSHRGSGIWRPCTQLGSEYSVSCSVVESTSEGCSGCEIYLDGGSSDHRHLLYILHLPHSEGSRRCVLTSYSLPWHVLVGNFGA